MKVQQNVIVTQLVLLASSSG